MNSSFRNSTLTSPNASMSSYSFSAPSGSKRKRPDGDQVVMSEGASYVLEHFGAALPSMVRVVLNKVDDPRNVSFRLDRNGWAWLVFRRHLYIWRYVADAKRASIPCRELLLPPSELFHHAKLITIVATASPLPACIAVSPEGHITFWPNISNESATVSINADLPGQECDSLTSVWPLGCILATTSATVLLIKPGPGTKPSLFCISLNSGSKGWLGGLSKRMSYLMPIGASTMETKRASVAVPLQKLDGHSRQQSAVIYVLAGTHFQIWSLNSEGQQCTCDLNVDELIRKQFQRHIWEENSDLRALQIWLLDIRADDGNSKKVEILAACLNRSEATGLLNYGIVSFDGTASRIRESIQLKVVNYRAEKIDGEEEALYAWKLLSTPTVSFMISQERILIIGPEDSQLDSYNSDRIGGPFIGGGHSPENFPLVFTPHLGLVMLRSNQSVDNAMNETFVDIRVPDHLALSMTQHNLHDLSVSEDNVNVYKSAFLHFCGKRLEECLEILNGLFPARQPSLTPHDPVDILSVALCEKLVDDAPIADPRWATAFGRSEIEDPLGLKSKLLIKNFLADKKKGLEIFFAFLRVTGVWARLSGVLVKDEIHATGSVLYNAYEKIGFAMTLHFLQTDGRYRKVVDPGIKSIVALRQESRPHSHLSFNDIFFKDVSRVHQILSALVHIEEEVLQEGESHVIVDTISITTEVILVLFSELHALVGKEFGQIRQAFLSEALLEHPGGHEVSPWFVQSHTLDALTRQTNLLVTASQLSESEDGRMDFFKQLEQLTDLILDGLKMEVESLKGSDRYAQKLLEFEGTRALLLGNLVNLDPSGGIQLAEKYLDFNILVSVTYGQRNVEGFKELFEKYYDLGFPVFTFEWFLKQKKDGELIQFFSGSKYAPLLSNFLKDYPSISWHHSTLNDDFYGASKTLTSLALNEESSLDDQKLYFCLAKLALLATGTDGSGDQDTYDQINQNLDVIQFQNELPDEALEAHGLDRKNMGVLSPSQIIDIYTSSLINPDLSNFWKAASIAQLLPNVLPEKRLLIVARAILSECWGEWSVEHPLDVIVPSLLYKFLSLVLSNGGSLDDYFNLQELSKLDILEPIWEEGNAKYLLTACAEYLRQGEVH